MKRMMIIAMAGIVLSVLLLTALWTYTSTSVRELEKQNTDVSVYRRSYALISEEHSDLWNAVFTAASEAAREQGVALEWVGADAPMDYTAADCLRIAIASRADGIILHRESADETTELINEAQEAGIPVITVMNDDPASMRTSFVGINNYQMGEAYGNQILQELHPGDNEVMVLVNRSADITAANLMYTQMLQTVENGKPADVNVHITEQIVNTATSFDAEEEIRDIFLREGKAPDVMVCLDLISTECASQALVDLNRVGEVSVIGYYASGAVREALSRGIIRSTLEIDAQQIGEVCIQALEEFHSLGHVSDYFNISFHMLTMGEPDGFSAEEALQSE